MIGSYLKISPLQWRLRVIQDQNQFPKRRAPWVIRSPPQSLWVELGFWRDHLEQQVEIVDHIWAGSTPLKDSGVSNVLGAAAPADPACGEELNSYPKAESGSGMKPADGKQHRSYVQGPLAARVRRLYKERLELSRRTAFSVRGVSLANVKSCLALRSHCFRTGQYVLSSEWRRNVLDWAGAEFVPTCEP